MFPIILSVYLSILFALASEVPEIDILPISLSVCFRLTLQLFLMTVYSRELEDPERHFIYSIRTLCLLVPGHNVSVIHVCPVCAHICVY